MKEIIKTFAIGLVPICLLGIVLYGYWIITVLISEYTSLGLGSFFVVPTIIFIYSLGSSMRSDYAKNKEKYERGVY